ncbi:MAG TPA: hypothetical protein VMK05_15175 [Burkholderiales bacterium]|nr:hypothetical protein [Burkholderiales bacterium]
MTPATVTGMNSARARAAHSLLRKLALGAALGLCSAVAAGCESAADAAARAEPAQKAVYPPPRMSASEAHRKAVFDERKRRWQQQDYTKQAQHD